MDEKIGDIDICDLCKFLKYLFLYFHYFLGLNLSLILYNYMILYDMNILKFL